MPVSVMSPAVPVKLSDDVQDIVQAACKLEKCAKNETPSDFSILTALLKTNRLFTRTDALLKACGAQPKALLKFSKQQQPNYASNALSRAQNAALQGEHGTGIVEIEHLMQGLLQSTDPAVQAVWQQQHVSAEKLNAAIPKVQQSSPIRFTLYCLRESIEVVLVVLFLVVAIKQGLGEFRLIPSESMLPTLQIGDRIVVEKVSHWYRPYQRGDILVFYPPEPEAILKHDPLSVFLRLTGFSGLIYSKETHIDTAFIKRLIGLPGDMIEVVPGQGVFVNGQLSSESYINEIANTCTFVNYCGPVQVPPNTYYMMGDNRNHSADSRFWQFLPQDRVIGRAVFRFFPLDSRLGSLTLKQPTS